MANDSALSSPGPAPSFGPRFAVVSDTHAAPWDPKRGAALARVFASIAAAHPDAVLHCGDLTEDGSAHQFAELAERVGPAIAPILHVVPGNHERRWDPTDGAVFREWFGNGGFDGVGSNAVGFNAVGFNAVGCDTVRFDTVLGGVRLLGLDPTQSLLEPGRFGVAGLAQLRARLDDRTNAPTVLFLHFPVGVDNFFVDDQADFLRVISDYDVRAIFAGHIHTEQVHAFNGLTHVVCDPAGSRPGYYWVEPVNGGDAELLAVSRVDVAEDGTENRRRLTTIALTGDGAGRAARPVATELGTVDDGDLPVTVRLRPDVNVESVGARVYPAHVFAAKDRGGWTALTEASGVESGEASDTEWTPTWTGTLDVSTVVPGSHRAIIRVATPEPATYDVSVDFEVPAGPGAVPTPTGKYRLDGSVQAGLAAYADVVTAASTHGEVVALRVDNAGRLDPLWRRTLGAVRRAPAFTGDGGVLIVPCVDDHLVALDARTGRTGWTLDTGAPVLSIPSVAEIGGREAVLATAGGALWAIDAATGEPIWRNPGHGIFAGRVATDGVRVYAGGGDGAAHAYDAATGAEVWAYPTNQRDDAYHRRIYGPWDGWVTVLPTGSVLVSTVVRAQALDPATGAKLWAVHGNHVYAEPVPTAAGVVLIAETGELRLVDPATGDVRLDVATGLRVLNTGVRIAGTTAWALGTTGQLLGVDLTTGQVTAARQLGTAQSFSSPVIAGNVLVAADQAGWVRALRIGPVEGT